jgi:PilZ domain
VGKARTARIRVCETVVRGLAEPMDLSVRHSTLTYGAELNRRSVPRYSVQAPITYSWNEGKRVKRGDGWTRDISGSGVFVFASTQPPVGASLQLQVILPPFGESGRILRILMDASVIRVEDQGEETQKAGFAVHGRNVVLRAISEGETEQEAEDLGLED